MPKDPKDPKDTGKADAFDEIDKLMAEGDESDEPRLHSILSNAEVLAARAKARERLERERRTKAMKRVEEEEVERLRLEEGLTTGDRVKDEIVDITIDLAPHSDRLVINGQAYYNGFSYPVPRHVADSLREQMSRGWAHQDEIDGKNKAQIHAQSRQFSLLTKGKAVQTPTSVTVGAAGVGGAVPKNVGLRAGPEDHAHVG